MTNPANTRKRLLQLKTDAQIIDSELQSTLELISLKVRELEKNILQQKEEWFQLIKLTLNDEGMMFCRKCCELKPISDSTCLAITETSQEKSHHGFETTYNIFRFCKCCAEKTITKVPVYGKYNKEMEGQSYFFAQEVYKLDGLWVRTETGGVLLEDQEKWYFGDDIFYNCGRCGYHLGGGRNHEITEAIDYVVSAFSLPRPHEIERVRAYSGLIKIKTESTSA